MFKFNIKLLFDYYLYCVFKSDYINLRIIYFFLLLLPGVLGFILFMTFEMLL